MTTVFFLATVLVAAFIQSFVGFGLGIVMIAFMPFYLPNITAGVCISNCTSVFLSGQNVYFNRKNLSLRRVLPILLPYIVSNTLTIVLLKNLGNDVMKKLLGVFFILYSLAFLLGIFDFKIKRSPKNSIIAGLLSGLLGGLFGTGGPPISVYLLQSAGQVADYHADVHLFFLLANIYSVMLRIVNGQITGEVLLYVAIAIPATVVGAFFGKKLLTRVDGAALKKYLYLFLILNGLIMVFVK